ncbi:alkaline shock response membrane anchor protein AmaP [Streptomyces coeruleoprunus]
MLRGVNRILIGLTGLLLVGVGGSVLVAGLWTDPDAVLLADSTRERWRDQGWWWPVVLGALTVLLLLALAWLAAQLRRPRQAEVLIDTYDGDGATLRGRALEAAVEAGTRTLEGVARAHVRVTGSRTAPTLRLDLLLEPQASPQETLAGLVDGPLAHARESTGLPELPAEVRLRATGHGPRRVL